MTIEEVVQATRALEHAGWRVVACEPATVQGNAEQATDSVQRFRLRIRREGPDGAIQETTLATSADFVAWQTGGVAPAMEHVMLS